jgi:XTP/dITP diphosphohydrolase
MILYACTTNSGKLREFLLASMQAQLADIAIEALPGLNAIAPPDETGVTFEENAALKASYYSRFTESFVFADDSGLEVSALGGAPGVRSARYAGEDGKDDENNALLIRNLSGVEQRQARFVSVVALARRGHILHVSRGVVEGEILTEARGSGGFGYDPLFYYPPFGCSFGEIDKERKFTVSHRGQALRKLLEWIASHPDIQADI